MNSLKKKARSRDLGRSVDWEEIFTQGVHRAAGNVLHHDLCADTSVDTQIHEIWLFHICWFSDGNFYYGGRC